MLTLLGMALFAQAQDVTPTPTTTDQPTPTPTPTSTPVPFPLPLPQPVLSHAVKPMTLHFDPATTALMDVILWTAATSMSYPLPSLPEGQKIKQYVRTINDDGSSELIIKYRSAL